MERNLIKCWVLSCFYVLVFSCVTLADFCNWHSSIPGKNKSYSIQAYYIEALHRWHYVFKNRKTHKVFTGPLQMIDDHAHLELFPSSTGKHFAVVDTCAGHHLENRIIIYDVNGNVTKAIGIQDLLPQNEIDDLTHSVMHLLWLKHESGEKTACVLIPEKNAIRLQTYFETAEKIKDEEDLDPFTHEIMKVPIVSITVVVRREILIDLDSGEISENKIINDPKWDRDNEHSDFIFEGPPESP